jgi:hypothetical protein
MSSIKVKRIHSHAEEPVRLYSELDKMRQERRKVEVFANGTAATRLQPLAEIASARQFKPVDRSNKLPWLRADQNSHPPAGSVGFSIARLCIVLRPRCHIRNAQTAQNGCDVLCAFIGEARLFDESVAVR